MTGMLVAGALRTVRRALLVWLLAIAGLIVLTTAFWPAFRDSPHASESIASMPSGVVEAFGLNDLASPAGFLWGNLYAFLIPLLMAVAGTAVITSLTARQEESGRYELVLTQPVARTTALTVRVLVAAFAMLLLGVAVLIVQLAADAVWDLEISTARLASTVALCTVTALVSVGATALTAGFAPHVGAATASGVGIVIVGYVVSALFPLREGLQDLQYVSPWNWALGGQPLTNAAEWWRYCAPLGLALLLTAVGLVAFNRRDIYAP